MLRMLYNLSTLHVLIVLISLVITHCWRAPDRWARTATYMRWFLAIIMITAGGSKLTYFSSWHVPSIIGPVWLEEKLQAYQLGLFARFVACSQLAIGLLLTSRRFAALGAVTLLPMLACILVITISLQWPGTPYVVGVMLSFNIFLLYHERRRLLPIIRR